MPTDSDRLKVSRYALDYLYRADESFNKYVDNLNKSVAEITMEDILDISFIEILELSEERLKYAKKYHEHSNEMSIDEYLSKQAPLLNKRHNLTFNAIGFDFPIDESITDFVDYLFFYLKNSPYEYEYNIPDYIVMEMMNIIVKCYAGEIKI